MRRGISDRRTFARLRRDGVWVGGSPLRARHLGAVAGDDTVRVAYATPKRIGSAVERNRIRRRIRGALDELEQQGTRLAPGATLFVVDAPCAALDPDALRTQVRHVIAGIERAGGEVS